MRKEFELLEGLENLTGRYDGLEITEEELEIIECMEEVEQCSYTGLSEGHGGYETYHVVLFGSNILRSVYVV